MKTNRLRGEASRCEGCTSNRNGQWVAWFLHCGGCPLGLVLELIFKVHLEGDVKSKVFSMSSSTWMEEKREWGRMQSTFLHLETNLSY